MNRNLVFLVVGVVAILLAAAPRVVALAMPVRVMKNVAVVCGASATPITSTGGMSSMCIQNNSATVATIGGSGVTPTTGYALSTATSVSWCGDVTAMWCSSAGGAVTAQVIYGAN